MKAKKIITIVCLFLGIFTVWIFMYVFTQNKSDQIIIKSDNIVKITATSQMSDPVEKIEIAESQLKELVDQMNSYVYIKESECEEIEKGWECAFWIEYQDGTTLNISYSTSQICIGDVVYSSKDYCYVDFKKFFEKM